MSSITTILSPGSESRSLNTIPSSSSSVSGIGTLAISVYFGFAWDVLPSSSVLPVEEFSGCVAGLSAGRLGCLVGDFLVGDFLAGCFVGDFLACSFMSPITTTLSRLVIPSSETSSLLSPNPESRSDNIIPSSVMSSITTILSPGSESRSLNTIPSSSSSVSGIGTLAISVYFGFAWDVLPSSSVLPVEEFSGCVAGLSAPAGWLGCLVGDFFGDFLVGDFFAGDFLACSFVSSLTTILSPEPESRSLNTISPSSTSVLLGIGILAIRVYFGFGSFAVIPVSGSRVFLGTTFFCAPLLILYFLSWRFIEIRKCSNTCLLLHLLQRFRYSLFVIW